MKTHTQRALHVLLALSLLGPSVALACGDKLVVLGGGVRFERVFQSRNPGKVIVFANPATKLGTANKEFNLGHALTHAGHTVQVVETRADLERLIVETHPDLVVMDWADAEGMRADLAARGDAPAILSVLYRPTAAELAAAQAQRHCVAEATKRKGRSVMRTIEEMMQNKQAGIPIMCDDTQIGRKT